jgi:hypothetical protein
MKKWILIYVLTGLSIILVNVFPRFEIQKMDDSPAIISLNQEETNLNESSFELHDLKRLDDGNTLISYDNGNLNCYYVHHVCDAPYQNARSQITLYNENQEVIWSIGGNLMIQSAILFENHHITIKAVNQLEDQSFVAFGSAVDLSTEVLYDVLLMIDDSGVMTELRVINILSYGYTQYGGHVFYDIESTSDGGFTLRLTDLFHGSVLIHFNEHHEEEWFIRFDDVVEGGVYSGIYSANYMETFRFVNDIHYLLLENHLYAYDLNGNMIWDHSYDEQVVGLTIDEEGNVFVSRISYTLINQEANLFVIKKDEIPVTVFITEKLNGSNGGTIWMNQYLSKTDYSHLMLYTHHVWQDREGNYYSLIRNHWYTQELGYEMLVFKFDQEGEFIGSSNVMGNYINHNNLLRITSVFLKKDVIILGDEVLMITPTLTFNASFDITDLSFDTPMPIDFSMNHYELTIQLRSMINTLFALTSLGIISFVGYHLFRRYYKRYPKLEDI